MNISSNAELKNAHGSKSFQKKNKNGFLRNEKPRESETGGQQCVPRIGGGEVDRLLWRQISLPPSYQDFKRQFDVLQEIVLCRSSRTSHNTYLVEYCVMCRSEDPTQEVSWVYVT